MAIHTRNSVAQVFVCLTAFLCTLAGLPSPSALTQSFLPGPDTVGCKCRAALVKQKHGSHARVAAKAPQLAPHAQPPRWVSPAELALRMTLRAYVAGGLRAPLVRYPIGCGFVQRMRQPAVWCGALNAPCPHQAGGGLARRKRSPSLAALAQKLPQLLSEALHSGDESGAAAQRVAAGAARVRRSAGSLQEWGASSTLAAEASSGSAAALAAEQSGTCSAPQLEQSSESLLHARQPAEPAVSAALVSLAGPAPLDTGEDQHALQLEGSCIAAQSDEQQAGGITGACPECVSLGHTHTGNSSSTPLKAQPSVKVDMFGWLDFLPARIVTAATPKASMHSCATDHAGQDAGSYTRWILVPVIASLCVRNDPPAVPSNCCPALLYVVLVLQRPRC